MSATINLNLLHWKGEKERLASSGADAIKAKARAWLPKQGCPKSIPMLRLALATYVDRRVSELEGTEEAPCQNTMQAHVVEDQPTTSTLITNPLDSRAGPLAADGLPASNAEGRRVQPASASQAELAAATDCALLARCAKENTWLRTQIGALLRRVQALEERLTTPNCATPVPSAGHPASSLAPTTVELVFFGLPLGEGASAEDASSAVRQFCEEQLSLPMTQSPDVVRMSACSMQPAGIAVRKPPTMVVARMAASQAHAILAAKRNLPGSRCPVSIDESRAYEVRRRLQLQRQWRRQVGGEERGARESTQPGGDQEPGERDVAPLH